MMKSYVDERRNNVLDRISTAIFLALVLWLVSKLLGIPHLGLLNGTIVNLILGFACEYSFEIKYSKWILNIRSSGKFYELDGILLLIIWPFAKIASLLGMENKPIMAYIMTAMYAYAMIFEGWQVLDGVYHIWVMYYLYQNRKENK